VRTYEMNVLRGIAGRSLSYNIEDQLLTVGSAVYQYNLDGFLRLKVEGADSTVYDYSSRGELLSVNLPSGDVIEYVHDPLGRRIAKKVNSAVVEKYLWSGLTRLLAVYDGADNLLMRFEYADGRMPVAMTQGGNKYYLAYDQVGSLRAVVDSTGTVIKRIDYDTFGNILADSNLGFKVPFGFAGGLYDGDTGLIRFGARDYDPAIGRWTAKDPIGFAGGDEDLYGYTLDDPVNGVDQLGLDGNLLEQYQWEYWNWEAAKRGAIAGGISGALQGMIIGGLGGGPYGMTGGFVLGGLLGVAGGSITGGLSDAPICQAAGGAAIGDALSGSVGGMGGAIGGSVGGLLGTLANKGMERLHGRDFAAPFGGAVGLISGMIAGGIGGYLSGGPLGMIQGIIVGGITGMVNGGSYIKLEGY